MSKNCVFAGKLAAISLPVPTGRKSGDPVKVGGFIGVCETDRNEGSVPDSSGNPVGRASVARDGCYALKVPEAVATEGTPIYITAGNALTTTATSNSLFGHTRAVIDKGVAAGGIKAVDSGGVEGTVNVELIQV